jgi:hypothetical protein
MRRIGRAACIVALAVLAVGSPRATSDEPGPAPEPDPGPVDKILAEWQAKASAITSVDVRFRMYESWSWTSRRYECRAVLASPNRAFLERRTLTDEGKVTGIVDRFVWDGRTILRFDMEEDRAYRVILREEWPAPPSLLCLPFFFRMTVEGAKRDYDWAVGGDLPGQIVLKVRPRAMTGSPNSTAFHFLSLDSKTFLPKRLISQDRDNQGRQTYEVLEIKVGAVEGLDDMMKPCLDSWTIKEVDGWFARMFLK